MRSNLRLRVCYLPSSLLPDGRGGRLWRWQSKRSGSPLGWCGEPKPKRMTGFRLVRRIKWKIPKKKKTTVCAHSRTAFALQ